MSSSHGGAPGFECDLCIELFHRLHQLILHKSEVHGVMEGKYKRFVSQYKLKEEKQALQKETELD